MEISEIRWIPYTYHLRRPIGDVNLPEGADEGCELAVFVDTDEGATGVSVGAAEATMFLPQLACLVSGSDPRSVRACWDRMVGLAFKAGLHGPMAAAVSAVDRALWDLRAKLNGVPLWKEMGGSGAPVRAYASGLDAPLGDEQLYEFYAGMAARGVTAGKLKVGRDVGDDGRRLEIMLEALASQGGRPMAIVDANEYWTPKQAVQRVTALERICDLLWVEEPVSRYDFEGLRKVSEGVRAPIASGENFAGPQDFVPLLVHKAADVVQVGGHIAGFTGARLVADMAAMFDRPVVIGPDVGESMAHVASTMRNHVMMEVFDVGREAALVDPMEIEDGCVVLSTKPGAGIEFDLDYLEAHQPVEPPARTLGATYRRASDAGLLG